MFDKKDYRYNRDNGLRGQGEYPPKYSKAVTEGKEPEYKYDLPAGNIIRITPKKPTKKAILKNSKRARKITV